MRSNDWFREKKGYFYLVFHMVYKSVGRNREIYTGLCCFSAMITSFQAKVNDLLFKRMHVYFTWDFVLFLIVISYLSNEMNINTGDE